MINGLDEEKMHQLSELARPLKEINSDLYSARDTMIRIVNKADNLTASNEYNSAFEALKDVYGMNDLISTANNNDYILQNNDLYYR